MTPLPGAPGAVTRHPRLGQLTLRPRRGEARTQQPQRPLVDEVTGLPARKELGVEPVQALDLKERVGQRHDLAQQPLVPALGAVHPAGEGGEVERELPQPALAQQLGGCGDHELGQPVRGGRVPAHE